MNLLWVAALAAVVLIEKLLPLGDRMARLGGLVLAAYGIWLLAAGSPKSCLIVWRSGHRLRGFVRRPASVRKVTSVGRAGAYEHTRQ
jgi:hypothetical protein